MKMARTKTTGPGKLHGQIFSFVRRDVSLTGRDWLYDGLELFKHESANYPRDYLVPSPSENWTAFRKKLLEPPQLANYFRMVLQGLDTPKFEDGEWRVNQSMELVPLNMSLYWSDHSPRHVMSQASASIGCAKDDGDFLGRWCMAKSVQMHIFSRHARLWRGFSMRCSNLSFIVANSMTKDCCWKT